MRMVSTPVCAALHERDANRACEPRRCTAGLKAPVEVSTAGSALNWRQVACEAGRRKRLAPEEHASLAHLVAGSARDHIAAILCLSRLLV